jgi:hypothetical protein
MAHTNTTVKLVDRMLGELGSVPVRQDVECTPIHVAASAYLTVKEASFQVGDDVFTVAQIEEWLA